MTPLYILYRGPLVSCNYSCHYCPFAKRTMNRQELLHDAACLNRFVAWLSKQKQEISLLFTPWGESLIHRHYQEAIASISHLPHVTKVAIQTNLSCTLNWIERCCISKIGLWATWHPTECEAQCFLSKCEMLHTRGVSFSVGMVGKREHISAIQIMRKQLPEDVYLWINTYRPDRELYTKEELTVIQTIDPYFHYNRSYRTYGKRCFAGHTTFTVDGDGTMRRCHFVSEPIGNVYHRDWQKSLIHHLCPAQTCHCHLGYVNLEALSLKKLYMASLPERIPAEWPQTQIEFLKEK